MIGKSLDIRSSVIRFFSKNFYTLILFALVLISAFSSIWLFYFEIVKDTNPLSSIPAHIVKTLFDAMVLMSPFFVVKRRGFVFIPLILLDVFCLSAVWYYRNYLDIIPFSSFLLYENLTPLLLESAFASARWIDRLSGNRSYFDDRGSLQICFTEKSAKRAEAVMVAGDRYLIGFCLFSYFSFGAGYKIETV